MKKRGVGLGISFYGTGYGNGFPDVSRAKVKLLKEGKIGIYVGATEVGQGAKTILTQIAAETLNLNSSNIVFINEDTALTPDSGTAAASRQTYNTGNAIKLACEKLKEKLLEFSRRELKLNSTIGLSMENGYVFVKTLPERKISIKELGKIYVDEKIESEATFTAQTIQMDNETGLGAPYWPYTFNACAVLVEVDTITGIIEVLDCSFAQDVGKAINPNLVEGQMDGGFSMALGYALLEDLKVENGKIVNDKYSKYLIPTAMDTIDIENIIVEAPESTSPYGAKGIGEPVTIPITPAILNAIYNAIGIRFTEIPVTPEKVVKAIKENTLKNSNIGG